MICQLLRTGRLIRRIWPRLSALVKIKSIFFCLVAHNRATISNSDTPTSSLWQLRSPGHLAPPRVHVIRIGLDPILVDPPWLFYLYKKPWDSSLWKIILSFLSFLSFPLWRRPRSHGVQRRPCHCSPVPCIYLKICFFQSPEASTSSRSQGFTACWQHLGHALRKRLVDVRKVGGNVRYVLKEHSSVFLVLTVLSIYRRYLFHHSPWPASHYLEFSSSCSRNARQEKRHLFWPPSTSDGWRTCRLEKYASTFTLRRSLPTLPTSLPQSHRNPVDD